VLDEPGQVVLWMEHVQFRFNAQELAAEQLELRFALDYDERPVDPDTLNWSVDEQHPAWPFDRS
jgi:hypothetical protein